MTLRRLLLRTALTIMLVPAAIYLGDWAVWRVRMARGVGMSSVHVSRIVVAPLKGGREEYYADGTADLECSRSLLPQAGSGACWWLARSPTVYDR